MNTTNSYFLQHLKIHGRIKGEKGETIKMKKKRKLDFDDENESKKRRSEDTLVEKYLIKCSAEIKLLNKIIYLNISYKGGETKDYVHQILQFIKNKFEKINI